MFCNIGGLCRASFFHEICGDRGNKRRSEERKEISWTAEKCSMRDPLKESAARAETMHMGNGRVH